MRHIALDFDDTLIPLRLSLVAFFNARFGTAHRAESITEYHFRTTWPITDELFVELFNANLDHFHTAPPLPGVLETLRAWQPHAAFHIITGRPDFWLPPAAAWLARHNITVASLHSSPTMESKGRLAATLNVTLAVEDNAEAANSYAALGIHTFLLDAAYNQCPSQPHLHRVNNWHDIRSAVPCIDQKADPENSYVKDCA